MRCQDEINTEHNMKSICRPAVAQWTERLTRKEQTRVRNWNGANILLSTGIAAIEPKREINKRDPRLVANVTSKNCTYRDSNSDCLSLVRRFAGLSIIAHIALTTLPPPILRGNVLIAILVWLSSGKLC